MLTPTFAVYSFQCYWLLLFQCFFLELPIITRTSSQWTVQFLINLLAWRREEDQDGGSGECLAKHSNGAVSFYWCTQYRETHLFPACKGGSNAERERSHSETENLGQQSWSQFKHESRQGLKYKDAYSVNYYIGCLKCLRALLYFNHKPSTIRAAALFHCWEYEDNGFL